jgi:hypothetical protein
MGLGFALVPKEVYAALTELSWRPDSAIILPPFY